MFPRYWVAGSSNLWVGGEWRVACHEEVEPRRGNERRYQTNQVVIHVTWVTERRRGDGHHCRNLNTKQEFYFVQISKFKTQNCASQLILCVAINDANGKELINDANNEANKDEYCKHQWHKINAILVTPAVEGLRGEGGGI